jgi:hypothetical protein
LSLELLGVCVAFGIGIMPTNIVRSVTIEDGLLRVGKFGFEVLLILVLRKHLLLLLVGKRAVGLLVNDDGVLLVHVLHDLGLVEGLLGLLDGEVVFYLVGALLLRCVAENNVFLAAEVVLRLVHLALERLMPRRLRQDL